MLLNEVYELVKNAGLASSEGEFSQSWLGHSECYLRTLRFKKAAPSLGSIAICASRLQKAGEQMVSVARYRQLGMRFLAMSERCHTYVNREAIEIELG